MRRVEQLFSGRNHRTIGVEGSGNPEFLIGTKRLANARPTDVQTNGVVVAACNRCPILSDEVSVSEEVGFQEP